MNEKEREKLIRKITELCKINEVDEQFVDFEADIDNTLTYSENYNILKDMYNLKDKNDVKEMIEECNEKDNFEKWHKDKNDGLRVFYKIDPMFVACVGERGSGKTALGHQICDRLRAIKKMPVYVLKYPKPKLITRIGYKNLKELRSLEHLNDIILWLDEPQLYLKKYEKRSNEILMEILSICRHRNIILVVTTSDTRWVNMSYESYIDVYFCKDIDYESIKQGSKFKYVIKQHSILDPQAFKLEKNEYLMYYRKDEEFQGKFTFELPKYWTEQYSKPYAIESATKNPN